VCLGVEENAGQGYPSLVGFEAQLPSHSVCPGGADVDQMGWKSNAELLEFRELCGRLYP
jgi:hypothetical protein